MSHLSSTSRRANALVVTLIVLVGVGSMLALTSDRLAGTRNLQSINLARQQASYAAEAVASLVETKLVQSSGDLANLTTSVVEEDAAGNKTIAQRWLQQGLYHDGQLTTKGMWLGDSLVFWRIEPVKIYDETIADTNNDNRISTDDTLANNFTNNYQANPNDIITPSVSWPGTSKTDINPGYYHFRIVSQAYFINRKEWANQGITIATADPWNKPDQAIASAQTQRMVQLKLINLFRYVIFYGATGTTGDIEMHPGASLNIRGAVHTNGALHLGGGGTGYMSGNYTAAAQGGAAITIGTSSAQSTITAVDGIFRTRKAGNYWYQRSFNPNPSYQFPYNIPIPHPLNGYDTAVRLNGVVLTPDNDSRKALVGHTERVRDQKNKGTPIVNTLANIPELSGYPFEHQLVVGRGQPLYQLNYGRLTIRPKDFSLSNPQQLFYADPTSGNYSTQTTPNAHPVYATDMPLFTYQNGTKFVNDVDRSPTLPVTTNVVPGANGMDGNPDSPQRGNTFLRHAAVQLVDQVDGGEARGFYLRMSLFGEANSGTTGLTIRERGAQNTAWRMLKPDGTPYGLGEIANLPIRGALPSGYPTDVAWVRAMSAYMARNYVVYLGLVNQSPADITARFFGLQLNASGQMEGTYNTIAELPALETRFMNRREADSYRRMGYLTSTAAPNYRVDVLNLNKERIQQIIRSSLLVDLVDPSLVSQVSGSVYARTVFNGLIYAHRTPRLSVTTTFGTPIHNAVIPLGYHPLLKPEQFSANGLYQFTGGLYPMIGSAKRGAINTVSNTPDRNGEPKLEVWSMYPSPKQVRITNGATTNWGGLQKSGRLQGLTIVTPNHCYVQGNYNTTPDPKPKADGTAQYPPCGVYADGLTMLTNIWNDANASYTATPIGDTATYNVSFVINNIPTDQENTWDEGSGGTHNLMRFLERGGRAFNFLGSTVVLNRMRYGRNYVGASLGYYGAPSRNFQFNSDLLTAEGQPPFSPWGVQVTRVLSSVNIVNR